MPGKDFIGYNRLMDKAMRHLVREALAHVAQHGLIGTHHFLISFDTRAPGVELSDELRGRYSTEMTIVMQHKFWNLLVEDDHFSVTLTFNKVPETILVPFHALRRFSDPSQDFGFMLQAIAPDSWVTPKTEKKNPLLAEFNRNEAPAAAPAPSTVDAAAGATVVSLDAFRKK